LNIQKIHLRQNLKEKQKFAIITYKVSSKSCKLVALKLILILTAIPGAISPLYPFGYVISVIENYALIGGTILILWNL
jgi:hypothetical protein